MIDARVQAAPAPWWAWPTLLSLDAPLVAVIWQGFFARLFEVALAPQQVLILAMSVWLVYAADRLLDGVFMQHEVRMLRHEFYSRYRAPLAALWLFIFAGALGLAVASLSSSDLLYGLLLCGLTLLYLLGVHASQLRTIPLFKEVLVGLLFAAGVALFTLSPVTWPKLLALLLFALLCFLNCAFIRLWETPNFLRGYGLASLLPRITLGMSLGLMLLASLTQSVFALCVSLSALGLYTLHSYRKTLGLERLRVLVDAVLLTPLIILCL